MTSDRKAIELRAPSGGSENRLCPGATLTVSFSATSAASEDTYAFVLELFRGEGDDADTFTPATDAEVRVDRTPPSVAVTAGPSNPSNSTAATVAFDVAGSPGEQIVVQCQLDGTPRAPCGSPVSLQNLADGPHTFVVTATDAAGNSASDTHSWTVETRSPVPAFSSGPARLTNSRSATFAFGADEPASFQCQLDGGSFLPCSSPASYQGLGDGAHTFTVRPTDGVGNTGSTASYSWRIDATAPETMLNSKPAARTALTSATFRFSSSEPAAFQCQLDRGAFAPCTSPKSYTRLARGAHRFAVRSVDAAGNADSTPSAHAWTVGAVIRRTVRSALLAPAAGARISRPPLLRWRPVRGATYYNVQLYRGGRKVLTAWPARAAMQLRSQWRFNGRLQRLTPGAYTWYVWPGRGSAAARRYGALLGTSTFVVTRAPRR